MKPKKYITYHCQRRDGSRYRFIASRGADGSISQEIPGKVLLDCLCTSEHETYNEAKQARPRI